MYCVVTCVCHNRRWWLSPSIVWVSRIKLRFQSWHQVHTEPSCYLFKLKFFYFMCLAVLPAYISIHHFHVWCLWKPEKSTESPGTSCELSLVLLSAGPSFQSLSAFLKKIFLLLCVCMWCVCIWRICGCMYNGVLVEIRGRLRGLGSLFVPLCWLNLRCPGLHGKHHYHRVISLAS